MSHFDRLIAAAAAAGEAPCAKFNCQRRRYCGDDNLACEAFVQFVRTGRAMDPHTRWPARHEGRWNAPVVGVVIVATHQIFQQLHLE